MEVEIEEVKKFMPKGWAAQNEFGKWNYFKYKPIINKKYGIWQATNWEMPNNISAVLNIKYVDDWKKSLTRTGE